MNKTTFGILTILFNSVGVPCFVQGQTKAGIIRIVLSCVTFGIMATINGIMGIIQGIKVLQMTEEEFQAQLGTIDMGIPKMIKEETAE